MPYSSQPLPSELKPQRKLHEARGSQRGEVLAKLRRIVRERRLSLADIVAHRIGCIESLPAELQPPLLTQREILAYAGIDLEHPVANHVIAYPRLAGPLWPERRLRRCRIGKDVGADAHAVHDGVLRLRGHGRRAVGHGVSLDVPVRRPGETVVNGDWETACPAEQSRDVPAAYQRLQH